MPAPSEELARSVVEQALGSSSVAARRFSTGLCHYVYEVTLADGRVVVARLATPQMAPYLAGDIYWRSRLGPLGVPVPAQLGANLSAPIPYLVLERLPGSDLADVYGSLDSASKQSIAQAVVDAQMRTVSLPEAEGFGYAFSYEDPKLRLHQHWQQIVAATLETSRMRMSQVGVVNTKSVDRVSALLPAFSTYFARVRPSPFLHDATTKNVIVHHGRLTGIVDLDEMGFGDPLSAVGLTQMALMSRGLETDYVDHWLALLNPSDEQRAVVNLYSAVSCVDFLGEQGQSFNRGATAVNPAKVAELERILDELIGRL